MKSSRLPFFVTLGVLVFFYLPIVVLIVNSFNAAAYGGHWGGFSLRWYIKLMGQHDILMALENTAIIAATATLLSCLLGTTAAFALHYYKSALQRFHFVLIYTPLVVPEILMGMSLLLAFVALGVKLGLFTIFLAHVTFCISYVTMVVLARLQDFDMAVIEAAQDLGANWWVTTWRVLAPMLAPGIASGALLALTLSFDDFVISFFVAGPGSTTLPIRIYSMIKFGSPAVLNALSTILLAVTFTLVWASQRLTSNKDVVR
ncbi:MAG TPA: ABC transporter permease [bacterium]|nr:ABC transporter permease [bacterium]HQG45997.1 ABC transporter permease [bacterium]HQI48542.1 ABC transporter permease [bacterium]HQJ63679.1 ABC transporter permease [bacterium]